MGNDARINWQITGDQAVTAGHGRIARSVEGIAAAENKAARAAHSRVRAQGGGGFGGGHGGFGGAIHAISRGGGRGFGGHAFHQLGGVASLSGPFLALGGAALGVSVALHAMEAASDRAAKSAMEEQRIRTELAHSIKSAVHSADSGAVSTFKTNEEALRSLAGIGGDSMVNSARAFGASNGPQGIQAYAALAAKGQLGLLRSATTAADTGQVGLLDAVKALTSGKVRTSGGDDAVAANILGETTGRSFGAGDVRRLRGNFLGSNAGTRMSQFDAGEGRLSAAGVSRFLTSSSIGAMQNEELRKVQDPEGFGRSEVMRGLQERFAELAAGSRAEWALVGLMKDLVAHVTGGEGSFSTQANEVANQMAQF